jgi:GTP-binding protein
LSEKPEILVLNKCDILAEDEISSRVADLQNASGNEVKVISGATRHGLDALMAHILTWLDRRAGKDQTEIREAWRP